VARLVAESGLDALRDPIRELPYRKVSVDCPDDRKEGAMNRLTTALSEEFPAGDVSTEHGVRVELDDGWVLVRPSGTEPKVRVYAESERVDALIERTVEVVEAAVAD
jgi:phosphomannomutase